MITVRGSIGRPDCGSSKPSALKAASSSLTNPMPAKMPAIEANRPIRNASPITVVSTWREEAPSVRSIPNSRVRWATVMLKMLKIRKAPTKIVIPAKISSAVVRKPKPSLISLESSLGDLGAGLRLGRLRQHLVEAVAQLLGADAVGGLDRDLVELARLVGHPLRLRQRHLDEAGAAERDAVAELRDARRACSRGRPSAPVIVTVSPTS